MKSPKRVNFPGNRNFSMSTRVKFYCFISTKKFFFLIAAIVELNLQRYYRHGNSICSYFHTESSISLTAYSIITGVFARNLIKGMDAFREA